MLAVPSKSKNSGVGYAALAVLLFLIHADVRADQVAAATTSGTLYERMGGAAVITTIADELIDRSAADKELQRSFNKVDLPRLKKLLGEQICALAGGPCIYSGDTMKEVHAGLNIRQDEFYGMVELLRDIMSEHGVGLHERNELLALLAPMKRDVVTR